MPDSDCSHLPLPHLLPARPTRRLPALVGTATLPVVPTVSPRSVAGSGDDSMFDPFGWKRTHLKLDVILRRLRLLQHTLDDQSSGHRDKARMDQLRQELHRSEVALDA